MNKKWFYSVTVLIMLGLSTASFFLYREVSSRYLSIQRQHLQHQVEMVRERLLLLGETQAVDWETEAQNSAALTGCRVTLVDGSGRRLADSRLGEGQYYSFVYDTEILYARNGEIASSILTDPVTGDFTLFLASPAVLVGETPVIVRLGYSLEGYVQLRAIMLLLILLLLMAEAAIGMIIFKWYQEKEEAKVRTIRSSEAYELQKYLQHLEQGRKQLDMRNSRISLLIFNMEDGLLVVDTDNRVTLVNPRAEELLEVKKAVFFGEELHTLEASDCAGQVLQYSAWVLAQKKDYSMTLENKAGRILQIHISPTVNKYMPYDFIGAQATIKDITEIRRLETLRRDFVANVSHELRTPLTAISGFTEMLRTDDDLTEEERSSALHLMGLETERLKQLISELLTLSRIENELYQKPQPEEIPVREILEQTAASLSPQAQKRNQIFKVQIEDTIPRMIGSPEWLRRIVVNLCDNAIKYTSDGGEIFLRAWAGEGGLWLMVSDNGRGIPETDLTRIYERFYRVDKARNRKIGSSGLGLAIVHHIVEEWGGTIQVKSKLGEGSEFTVWLPGAGDN